MTCTKRRYKRRLDAKIGMMSASGKHDRKGKPTEKRVYWCPECKALHLTSRG
jgi:hypothetical protein